MEKTELIKQLESILPIMKQADAHLLALEQMDEQITSLQNRYDEPHSIDFHGFCTEIFLGALLGMYAGAQVYRVIRTSIVVFVCIAIGIAIDWTLSKKHRERQKEKIKQEIEYWQKEYEAENEELVKVLAPHWEHILEIVPQKYAVPFIIRHIHSYLIDDRADSMKEAINLFEEEQHRWRMEASQRQMQAEYQRELEAMQEAQKRLEHRVLVAEHDAMAAQYALYNVENHNY